MKIAGLMMALAMAGAAQAQTVNMEELKLYPERYAGKAVTLDGIITMAERDFAIVSLKAGRLKDFALAAYWKERDKTWEFAQYECSAVIEKPLCKAKVSGTIHKDDTVNDRFTIENATVEFLNAPK